MTQGGREIEIKLAVADRVSAGRLLRRKGLRVSKRRAFEANVVYDTPGLSMREAARLLRVRRSRGSAVLTYKGPPAAGRHKDREELELEVADAGALGAIFERLGYRPVFRYEKYRTEFREPGGRYLVTLDETPIGVFLELEGSPRWIDRMARRLGFGEQEYLTGSYGRLYLEWCGRHGVTPKDMVFGPQRAARGA